MSVLGSMFKLTTFSFFVGVFIIFFTLVVLLYSLGSMRGQKNLPQYYFYIILTMLSALGVVLANDLLILLVFWGFLGVLLYLLISFGQKERTSQTAKKALMIVAGTDLLMILGIGLVWRLVGTLEMDKVHILLTSPTALVAYLCFVMAAFAKAGAMPFHTWIPDTAVDAPVSVAAFLPASLDKLLGIYFLARVTLDIFHMNHFTNTFLMAMGSLTIIFAVMMALVQHDLKKLLGYHAVSQVGYMVLGLGTGNPVGIAGGLFHMLNHAIYKSCLFLSAGVVEKKAGTTDLDKLGGLAQTMPVIFISFLIASLAISGVPPLNGFASKWMIYSGIIQTAKGSGHLWILWLMSAMFGSALTLASFMKLVHAVFLGQPFKEIPRTQTPVSMWFPVLLLASLCVVYGVFSKLPLKVFILPSLGQHVVFGGVWNSYAAFLLLLSGLFIGLVIFLLGKKNSKRLTAPFVGGEDLSQYPEMRISGTQFYRTIEDMVFLKKVYALAEQKVFDIYDVIKRIAHQSFKVLSRLHNGILPTYMAWCLLGMIVLFYVLIK
ncbi:MAG: hypothetical protein HQL13_01575 [Candidatus Omnitrophica bacterium]|nr:hypothetical protein [Candidatus Omnitrophota bacterium]